MCELVNWFQTKLSQMIVISSESLDMLHPSQIVGNQFEADHISDCIHSRSGISYRQKDKFNKQKKKEGENNMVLNVCKS